MEYSFFNERNLLNYDRTISKVEKDLSSLGDLLSSNGYPGEKNLLSVLFVDNFIQESETKPLEEVNPTLRGVLGDIVLQRLDKSFLSKVEDLRREILGASVPIDQGGGKLLDLCCTDFENVEGTLRISPKKRDEFKERITISLNGEEKEVCKEMEKIILSLRGYKSRGWNVCPLIEKYLGKYDFLEGADIEGLPRDIVIYRKKK